MLKLLMTALCLLVPATGIAAQGDEAAKFVGAWSLVSYQLTFPSGAVSSPFGDHPKGILIYEKGGQMSVQFMRPGRAPFADPDSFKATAPEVERAWRGYTGYWGTYTVDSKAKVVVHHIEGGWFPNWVGQAKARSFQFEGNQLILEGRTPAWTARLVWQKME